MKMGAPNYLEYPAMNRVQKPSGSECHASSSEPFRFYFNFQVHCKQATSQRTALLKY
jgi:hypothetical protein